MFEKLIHILYDVILARVVQVIGIIMVVVILLQIGSRTILPQPFSWTVEYSRLLFIWFAFLGSVVALRQGMHLGIQIIYEKFSLKNRRFLDVFIYLSIVVFGSVMSKYGFELTQIGSAQKAPVTGIPMPYFYVVVPVTGILFIIYSVYRITVSIRDGSHHQIAKG